MRNDNWDVVFACSSAYLNQRLVDESLSYVFSFRYEDDGVTLQGTFDVWSIAPNGSGEILQFNTPIKTGTAIIKSNGKTYTLDGAVPLVQLQLAFIDGANTGQQQSLVFNCSTVGQKAGDSTPGAVTVLDPDISGKAGIDPLAKDLIVPALAQCFVDNRDKLSFVFADIGLVPPQNAGWMTLKRLAYCYQQNVQDTLGNFGVLGVFDDIDISGYSKTFDSALLRQGDEFGFILSGTQLLKNVILPGLSSAFQGSSPSQFQMSGASIVNNGAITLSSVKVGLIWYPPQINTLNMHIENNYISTYLDGTCPITGLTDAYVSFSMSEQEVAAFSVQTQALSFTAINKQVAHSTYIPSWEQFLGGLTLGLMNVIIDAVSLAIENAVGSQVSGSGLDAANLGAFRVNWQPRTQFVLTDGGLQDNFYFRGMHYERWVPVYQMGAPGTGIGGYNLLDAADRVFAFDYDGSGRLDHLVLYRPGQGTIWILRNNGGNFTPVYQMGAPGTGIGGYNLLDTADRVFAFDYDGSGRLDHLVLYRPGQGTIWILRNNGGNFTPVYQMGAPGTGIGGYNLLDAADRVFAFDYDGSGRLDHLVLYRPGQGTIWILRNNGGNFTPVYQMGAPGTGIGGYNLLDAADRVFAFDYDGSGRLDHLVLYRPGQGTIWILRNNGGNFTPVYQMGAPGTGIGGYNLLDAADRVFAFDYDGSGRLDHLVLYRPGQGTIWILRNNGGNFTPVYQMGAPGTGIGGYDLLDAADRVFAFDYDGSGNLDYLTLYRPGKGTIWIMNKPSSKSKRPQVSTGRAP